MLKLLRKDSSQIENAARDIFAEQAKPERERASVNRGVVFEVATDAERAAGTLLTTLKSGPNDDSYDGDFAEVKNALDGIRSASKREDIASLNGEFHPASVLDVTSRHADALGVASDRLRHAVNSLMARVSGLRDADDQIKTLHESVRRLSETMEGLTPKTDVYIAPNLAQKRADKLLETRTAHAEKTGKLTRKESAKETLKAEGIGGVEVTEETPLVVLEVLNDVRRQLEDVNIAELSPRDAKGKYASVYEAASDRIRNLAAKENRDRSLQATQEHKEHVQSLGPKCDAVIAHHDTTLAGKRGAYVAFLDSLYTEYLTKLAQGGKEVSGREYDRMILTGYADIDRKSVLGLRTAYKQSEKLLELLPDSLEDILILIDMAQQKIKKRLITLIEGKKKAEAKMVKTGKKGDLHEICADLRTNTHIHAELEQLKSIAHMAHPVQSLRIAGSNAMQWLMSFMGSGHEKTA